MRLEVKLLEVQVKHIALFHEGIGNNSMRFRRLLLIVAGFALLVLLLLVIPGKVVIQLSNGGTLRIVPSSTLGALKKDATTTIFYSPKVGSAGTVTLWQDSFDRVILVIPSTNANVLLCLYDHDTSLPLLRIDTGKAFKPFPAGSSLTGVVSASSWEVELGATNDWNEAYAFLKNVSSSQFRHQSVPTLGFGALSLHPSRDAVRDRFEFTTVKIGE